MTKIYIPRLIESAEQAEALPDDAIVIGVETGERYTRSSEGEWWGVTEMGTRLTVDLYAGDAVIVLVPIEAEEETRVVTRVAGILDREKYPFAEANFDSDGNVWFGDGWWHVRDVTEQFNEWAKQHTRTRYVTPWTPTEEA